MSLQYQICFLVLVVEILGFLLLSFPVGRRQVASFVRFIKDHPQLQQLKTVGLVIFSLIGLLFLDAVNRAVLQRPMPEVDSKGRVSDPLTDAIKIQKKFLAQRNLYLTGATLLMAFVLTRYYSLLVNFIQLEHRFKATGGKAGHEKEVEEFRKKNVELSHENKKLLEENKKLKADDGVRSRKAVAVDE